MFWRRNKHPHWDLEKLSDEELSSIPLDELQRIRNKRWAYDKKELQDRAEKELARRDPREGWTCHRCGKTKFHEKQMRVSGGFAESFLGWGTNKYHAIICNYCGKTEFYRVMMSGSQKAFNFFGS